MPTSHACAAVSPIDGPVDGPPLTGPSACRVLVTGAAGFVGRSVLAALAEEGGRALLGIGRGQGHGMPAGVPFHSVDLADGSALRAQVRAFRPSHVLHLAAQSSVAQASHAAAETWRTNVVGSLNLAEAIRADAPGATVLFASSSEVYGRSFLSGEPLAEDAPLQPVGSYARTKRAAEDMLADVLAGSDNRLIIVRPFNHTGPDQDERFVVPSFAGQIARIEAGLAPRRLEVGNMSAEREFLDVRDVARAYACVIDGAERIASGTVLNIASGAPRTIASVLEDLRGLSRVSFEVTVSQDRLRRSEIPRAAGDASRLRALTGWAPVIPWGQTVADVLATARLRHGAANA